MKIIVEDSVEEFVKSLEKSTISKVSRLINLLENYGNLLSMPYSKKVSNELFELRIRGQQEVRIFYQFHQGGAILLHGFIKKTQKMPLRELQTASKKLRS